jgi:hypothetical protein
VNSLAIKSKEEVRQDLFFFQKLWQKDTSSRHCHHGRILVLRYVLSFSISLLVSSNLLVSHFLRKREGERRMGTPFYLKIS